VRTYRTDQGWRARTLFRDFDGKTRHVERSGKSRAGAERSLAAFAYQYATERHIVPGLGKLHVRELTIGAVHRFLRTVADHHGYATAKMCRSVLNGYTLRGAMLLIETPSVTSGPSAEEEPRRPVR
jgi:hypothetical protein